MFSQKLIFSIYFFSDFIEIKTFLESLVIDKIYVCTFELTLSESLEEDDISISLTKPILITTKSSPILLSKFLLNKVSLIDDILDLNYFENLINSRMKSNKFVPYILVRYNSINLF